MLLSSHYQDNGANLFKELSFGLLLEEGNGFLVPYGFGRARRQRQPLPYLLELKHYLLARKIFAYVAPKDYGALVYPLHNALV